MSYHTIALINLCIVITAAVMYLVGFVFMIFGSETFKKKGKLLQRIAVMVAIITQVISVILMAYKTGVI